MTRCRSVPHFRGGAEMRVQHLTDADFPLVLGRYTLTGSLGRGGMARVFSAEISGELGFVRRVALKFVVGVEGADGARLRAQFAQEAVLGGLLNHPGLCQVFDCGLHDGVPFLAMERIDGLTLEEYVRRLGPMPAPLAVQVTAQAARALHAAHEAEGTDGPLRLVHRDLKPSNIMVTWGGTVKVMDFGIARTALRDRESTAIGVLKGTVVYMAPEQAREEPLDRRTDLFSLGSVLWSLLSGTLLFGADSIPAALFRIVQAERILEDEGRLAWAERLLPGLGDRLSEVLRDDPADRPASAREWADRLDSVLPPRKQMPSLPAWLAPARTLQPGERMAPATASDAALVARDRAAVVDATTRVPQLGGVLLQPPLPWVPKHAAFGGTLRLANYASAQTHALLGTDLFSSALVEYTQVTLFRPDPDETGVFRAELARSMRSGDEPSTFLLELRDDLKWHPPRADLQAGTYRWSAGEQAVTAHDVVFALDLMLTPGSDLRGHRFGRALDQLDSWEAVDDHTLRVRFCEPGYLQTAVLGELFPVARFLYSRGPDGDVLDAADVRARFRDHWYGPVLLGCGPYRLDSHRPQMRIELARDPAWPMDGNCFDRVHVELMQEPRQWAERLAAGRIDFMTLPSEIYRAEVLDGPPDSPFRDGSLAEGELHANTWICVAFNNERAWFRDPTVRRALGHAFRAQSLLSELGGGLGRRISGPLARSSPFYDPSVPLVAFDLPRAAEMLDAAGWIDSDGDGVREKTEGGRTVRLDFTLLVASQNTLWQEFAQRYADDLARVGVRMRLRGLPLPELIERGRSGRFDAAFLGWGGGPDPNYGQLWHSGLIDHPAGGNWARLADPEIDDLIEQLAGEFEGARRVELGRSIHRRLADLAPVIFFYSPRSACFWSRRLRGVSFSRYLPHENLRSWWFEPDGS